MTAVRRGAVLPRCARLAAPIFSAAAGSRKPPFASGMLVVADGTPEAAARLERVLTTDPGMGVLRHADAGYERAIQIADERGVRMPIRR